MIRKIIISIYCFLALSILIYGEQDSVRIDTINNYQGWGWDVLVIQNNFITLAIVPAIGARVLQYDLGVDTFMIVNDDLWGQIFDPSSDIYGPWSGTWAYGGYKTWPAPQSDWPGSWPPPPIMDWGNYEFETIHASNDSVTVWLKGQTEQYQAPDLRFDRYITVYRNTSRVKVITVLFNDDDSPQEKSIWDVTQTIVQHGNENDFSNFTAYFPASSASDVWGSGPYYEEVLPGVYEVKFVSTEGKISTATSEGWTCFIDERDKQTYAKVFDLVDGAEYTHNGASVEFYTSGSSEYMEVEVLGPIQEIGSDGDSIVFVEDWYAAQNSGPVYTANRAGMVTKKLDYHRPSNSVRGEYGAFHEGELRIKYLNSGGTETGEGPSISVAPDTMVQLSETITLPASTASIELQAYDVDDSFIGILDKVDIKTDDSFIAYKAPETPVIDGYATDACWDTATWYTIDYVWLPYNDYVDPEDFTGRFKISWTDERLILLVEVVDDVLYDIYTNPLDNYWNDDCVEVFVDEDHSGGNHLYSYNAFAYHVSTLFDVVDNGTTGSQLFNSHIDAARTRSDSLYTWELSIKIFDDTYVNESSVPVTLTNDKEMGFSLAYCDNDASATRENFIGSKYLQESESNDSYINASLFGTLTLVDPNAGPVEPESVVRIDREELMLYPNPASDKLFYRFNDIPETAYTYSIIDIAGQIVLTGSLDGDSVSGSIDISELPQGAYIINFRNRMGTTAKRINKF